jgi:uncharacterized SAM-binding protein YcdF (DUF218 family)
MIFVLFLMLLVTLLLYRLRWRRLGHVLSWLTVLLFLGIGCGPVPRFLTRSLQGAYYVDPVIEWAPRNVIVLLSGGTVHPGDEPLQPQYDANGRILRAVQLYNACKRAGQSCRLLVTGGDAQTHGEPESVVYARALRRLGVPEADLTLETRSMSTWQNAQFSRPLLASYAPQHVVLVTSGIHLQRSLLYFAHFGIAPQPVAGDWVRANSLFVPVAWNFVLADLTLHEYLGILRYRVYNMLGWNAPKAPPLAP